MYTHCHSGDLFSDVYCTTDKELVISIHVFTCNSLTLSAVHLVKEFQTACKTGRLPTKEKNIFDISLIAIEHTPIPNQATCFQMCFVLQTENFYACLHMQFINPYPADHNYCAFAMFALNWHKNSN